MVDNSRLRCPPWVSKNGAPPPQNNYPSSCPNWIPWYPPTPTTPPLTHKQHQTVLYQINQAQFPPPHKPARTRPQQQPQHLIPPRNQHLTPTSFPRTSTSLPPPPHPHQSQPARSSSSNPHSHQPTPSPPNKLSPHPGHRIHPGINHPQSTHISTTHHTLQMWAYYPFNVCQFIPKLLSGSNCKVAECPLAYG